MSRFAGLRNFLLIWAGQLVSGVGSRLTSFALAIHVYQTTGSTTRFAMIFVAMAVPAIVVAPFAGALVDRWDRRRTMLACELVSAVTLVAMAVLLAFDALALWLVYVGVGISALANTFLQPAYAASIPLLASQRQLDRVNGMVQTGFAVAQVGGPLLAGVLVGAIAMHGVMLVNAATYLVGAIALYVARVPRPVAAVEQQEGDNNLWREAATGFRYVRERPGLLGLLTVFGISNFLFGIASIAITPLVLSFADVELLGVQMAIGGVGLLLGGVAISTFGAPRRRVVGVLGFYIVAGLLLAAHGLGPSFALVVVAGFLFFITLPVINSSNAALWQTKVPSHLLGRCFSIQRVLSEAAMPIGYGLAGPLSEHVFEPLLAPDGALAHSLGQLIGVGAGRGIGLMFMVLGGVMALVAIAAYAVPAIRRVEQELPDAPPVPAASGT